MFEPILPLRLEHFQTFPKNATTKVFLENIARDSGIMSDMPSVFTTDHDLFSRSADALLPEVLGPAIAKWSREFQQHAQRKLVFLDTVNVLDPGSDNPVYHLQLSGSTALSLDAMFDILDQNCILVTKAQAKFRFLDLKPLLGNQETAMAN
jgi:hypothetical protein